MKTTQRVLREKDLEAWNNITFSIKLEKTYLAATVEPHSDMSS